MNFFESCMYQCRICQHKCCAERCLIDDHEIEIFHQPGPRIAAARPPPSRFGAGLGGSSLAAGLGGRGPLGGGHGSSTAAGGAGGGSRGGRTAEEEMIRKRMMIQGPEIMSGRGWNTWGAATGNAYHSNPGRRSGPGGEHITSARGTSPVFEETLNSARKYMADQLGRFGGGEDR